ncbi:hypothetical protein V5799_024819 [Amblyomma americanum]|uniref:Uncharacterized protein n=1 Tax=Amblyomma americanum TaxID=6943 RepID=A0AAQ4EB10_AMBAM
MVAMVPESSVVPTVGTHSCALERNRTPLNSLRSRQCRGGSGGTTMAASFLASFARAATSLLTAQLETQLQSVRCKSMRASRRIRGHPRPLLDNVQRPEPHKYAWLPILPADRVYTTEKLPIRKLGGRDPVTGRVVVRTIGGGMKRYFRWIDHKRLPNEDGSKLEERVYQVRYDPLRTAHLALVASGGHKRWLTATEGVKPGDIIATSGDIPRIPVQPKEGDAHPLGALPVSTLVHHIEKYPGEGGVMCRAAGTSAQILRKPFQGVVGTSTNRWHHTSPTVVPGRAVSIRYRVWQPTQVPLSLVIAPYA